MKMAYFPAVSSCFSEASSPFARGSWVALPNVLSYRIFVEQALIHYKQITSQVSCGSG